MHLCVLDTAMCEELESKEIQRKKDKEKKEREKSKMEAEGSGNELDNHEADDLMDEGQSKR